MLKITPKKLLRYCFTVLMVGMTLLLMLVLSQFTDVTATPYLLFFLPVILSAGYGGLEAGLVATGLTALAIAYFLLPPAYSLAIASDAAFRLFLFILQGVLFSGLIAMLQTAHKRSQIDWQKLHTKEEQLRLALNAAAMGNWDWNLTNNQLTWSEKQEMLFGLKPGTFNGDFEAFLSLVHPEDRESVTTAVQNALNSKTAYQKEYRIVWPDGNIHWIAAKGEFLYDKNGNATRMMGVSWDISDRKTSEQILENANQRIRHILESTTDGFVGLDQNWRVTYINNQANKFDWGQPESAMGKIIWEYWPWIVGTIIEQNYRYAMAEKVPVHFEVLYEPLNIWFEVHAYPYLEGLSIYFRDITESKRSQDAIQASKELLQYALDAADLVAWDWHVINDEVMQSKNAAKIMGLHPGYAITSRQEFFNLIHPEDRQKVIDALQDAIGEPVAKRIAHQTNYQSEFRIVRPVDNKIIWMTDSGRAICDDSGKVVRLSGVIQDITEQQAALLERKQIELALQESEQKFRFLAEFIPQIVWTARPDGWVDYYNQRWFDYTGMTLEETQGWGWESVVHPDDLERCIERWRQAYQTGSPYEIEYRFKRASDGTYRWHLGRALPMKDQNGQITKWFGTCTDIDDQKRYEEALQNQAVTLWNQQQWLEELFNLMPTPMLLIEPGTAKVTFANKAADELAGGEFPKDKPAEEYHTIYYYTDALGNRITNEKMPGVRVARGERLDSLEINWHTPGGIRPLLIYADTLPAMHGHPEICVLIFQDLTKLKQAEAAVQQSESRFRHLIESNVIGVVIGKFSGEISEANDAFLNLVGYTRQELQTGQLRWDDITTPETLEIDIRGQQQMLKTGACPPYEKEYILKNGKRVPVLVGGALLEGYQDTVVAFVLDLTERKQLENALRQQAEELAKTNRMKDEFLAVVSHELRSPLNSMLGWSQMLRSRNLSSTMMAKAIETIERNAKNQKQLIEDLLDVSRIITGKLRLNVIPVELTSIIQAAIDTVSPAAQAKSIDFIFSILDFGLESANPNLLVGADPDRLQQVIWNLLSNAIKFTPNGGKVEVKLSAVIGNANAQPITNYQSPITNFAQITVTDSGIGIKPEFLPYVFDRFRQADSSTTRSYGGLGLGLAIVRHLVELHGGVVSVTSQGEGKGATFTIQLPLQTKKTPSPTLPLPPSPTPPLSPSLARVKLLVVDDDRDTRDYLVAVLKEYCNEIKIASCATEAIAILQQEKPDMIISDIGMPDIDGYALIQKVRSLPKDQGGEIRAIALTAYARLEDRTKAIQAGFQAHISKPISPDELINAVANLANR